MVFQLSSKEDVGILESTFQAIDKDGNGTISKEELIQGYRFLYKGLMCEEEILLEIEVLWENADLDGNGKIDYTEWALSTANKDDLLTDRRLRQAFDLFDIDKSGYITADELKRVIDVANEQHSMLEWQLLIDEIDESGDGKMSYAEFKSLMRELLLGPVRKA